MGVSEKQALLCEIGMLRAYRDGVEMMAQHLRAEIEHYRCGWEEASKELLRTKDELARLKGRVHG